MRGAEIGVRQGEAILLMVQCSGFSRFSRSSIFSIFSRISRISRLSLEHLIPVPSPRNRANHGPSMPCLSWPTDRGNKQKVFCTEDCVFLASQVHQKLQEKVNITRASSDADKCHNFGTSPTHQRCPETHQDAPETQLMQCDGPHFQTAEVQQPPMARLGNVGLWL